MGHVRFGFAAGCEAVAVPRRIDAFMLGLCPRCGLWPNESEGLNPDQGQSPEFSGGCRRGIATASHPAAKPKLTVKCDTGKNQTEAAPGSSKVP
jgi:hypothetical protein